VLIELRVRDLGLIEDAYLSLGAGMTALTGETGAGKTLLVEALELLVGGRADPVLVRAGAPEAVVEGRFSAPQADDVSADNSNEDVFQDDETTLARSLPASGRSRAWVDGRMATAAALSETGSQLVDLHGQHAHQSLLDSSSQRAALDAFAGVDLGPVLSARARLRNIAAEITRLGGNERERAREKDLLIHQTTEIASAGIAGPDEDQKLLEEENRLSDASALRQAASHALTGFDAESSGVLDSLGRAVSELEGRDALDDMRKRALGLQADAADLASDLRRVVETWEDDPDRLVAVSARRARLADLRRKYGDTLEEVITYGYDAERRLSDIESNAERVAELGVQEAEAKADLESAEAHVGDVRRKAAPKLAKAVVAHLHQLAMPAARIEVAVGPESLGDEVTFLLAANPGEPGQPLQKVASGGELARTMLALRLVVSGGRPTLIFDEVDAGIGGAAADTVGRALSHLAESHQVLVVTHLPQVAAFAEHHLVVEKEVTGGRTRATVRALDDKERVVELARMLSGRPASTSARRHAKELLDEAAKVRVGAGRVD
jgi:DNA repair protein RecN (Recombination protein N)